VPAVSKQVLFPLLAAAAFLMAGLLSLGDTGSRLPPIGFGLFAFLFLLDAFAQWRKPSV
jgi:hypothetical protein